MQFEKRQDKTRRCMLSYCLDCEDCVRKTFYVFIARDSRSSWAPPGPGLEALAASRFPQTNFDVLGGLALKRFLFI